MDLLRLFLISVFLVIPAVAEVRGSYDPLKISGREIKILTLEVSDASRDRIIPLRIYIPNSEKPAPVILFSHGLGGSRDNNAYLGNHWSERGYFVVFMQHPGSDENAWKDTPPAERLEAMKAAASTAAFVDRMKDVPLVIDSLEKWNSEKGNALKDRMDLEHLGMSGHSFGAVTTQALAGQIFGGEAAFHESRIRSAVMMSPSLPRNGNPAQAFGSIKIPCLLLTGTQDDSPIGDTKAAERALVFKLLTNAPSWLAVFDGADHMSFSERKSRGKNSNDGLFHERILSLTTAFWDTSLRNDEAAEKWLNEGGARNFLNKKDRWEQRNPKHKIP